MHCVNTSPFAFTYSLLVKYALRTYVSQQHNHLHLPNLVKKYALRHTASGNNFPRVCH